MHLLPSTTLSGKNSIGRTSINTSVCKCRNNLLQKDHHASSSRSVINVAIKKKEPFCLLIRFPFLPIHPSPLRCAHVLSSTGALSTNPLPFISPIFDFIILNKFIQFFPDHFMIIFSISIF